MNQQILIIEDEKKVAESVKTGLVESFYFADIALNGLDAIEMVKQKKYDLIILDINLPKINGYDVCREIRKENQSVPIIMLTAFGTLANKVTGFDAGADDYLVKPFEFIELLARIKSLLKRTIKITPSHETILRIADLELNIDAGTVKRDNQKISLTAKEFLLLEYLLRNQGRVCSKIDIAEKLWDKSFGDHNNVIEVYINFLRKKIDKNFPKKLLHTYIGMGYVLKEE